MAHRSAVSRRLARGPRARFSNLSRGQRRTGRSQRSTLARRPAVAPDRDEEGRMMLPCRVAMANSAQREFVVLRGPQSLVRYVADWLLNRVLAVSGTRAICLA